MLLEVSDLVVERGRLEVLHGLSFAVGEAEVCSLVGTNGAGKTTLMQTISGLLRALSGRIVFDGKDITTLPAHARVAQGIAHVPEGRWLFANMTVEENLELGAYLPRSRATHREQIALVYDLFPRLAERRGQRSGTLSGGEQQMVAIGRALVGQPRLLILDEPSLGLAPIVVKTIFDAVRQVNRAGVAVLIVEQNVREVLTFSDRAYVVENGVIALSGTGSDLLEDPRVTEAYLGYRALAERQGGGSALAGLRAADPAASAKPVR